jgi:hypothetical protein
MSPAGAVMARRPLKRTVASVLLPTVSATCVLWCRADGIVTKPDSNPATVSGDSVNAITDQTYSPAQGHNLVSQVAGVWPTYQLNQVNGKPCVRFSTNSTLGAAFSMPAPFDIFVVLKPITYVAESTLVAGASGDTFSVIQHGTTPAIVVYNGSSLSAGNTGLVLGTWALLEAGGSTGTSAFTKVNTAAAVTGGTLTVADRGGIQVAGHPGSTNLANMDLAEIIVYSSVLSGTDATAVRAYITGRYGFP